ncbi:MAG: hypothetical protein WBA74_18465 [Cyclobacteriaceae bacterium]
MNQELEQKLWNAGQSEEQYTQEIWNEIIQSLLDNFQKFILAEFRSSL